MKNIIVWYLSIFAFSLSIFSCGPVPGSRIGGGSANGSVSWRQSDGSRALIQYPENRSIVNSIERSVGLSAVEQWYDTYYAGLGSKVNFTDIGTQLTPSKFLVPVLNITLANSGNSIPLHPGAPSSDPGVYDIFHADFTDTQSSTPETEVISGIYDIFYLHIGDFNNTLGVGEGASSYFVPQIHNIIVEIPGYTDTDFPNAGQEVLANGATVFSRYYLGNNKFRFTFYFLSPDRPNSANCLVTFCFGNFDSTEMIVPGYDGIPSIINTSDYTNNYQFGSSGNYPLLLVPFEGVLVSAGTDDIKFNVGIDLDGIIEVYDSNTPAIKSDDKVVLTNRFWERISLAVEQN